MRHPIICAYLYRLAAIAIMSFLILTLLYPVSAFAGQESAARPSETVVLQLKWMHQFQFAGYYAAIEKGYYREAGLDVKLVEGGMKIDYEEEVLSGRAQYGVGNPNILIGHAEGDPIIAIAAILQHSPEVLVTLKESGIDNPHGLIGKKVALSVSAETLIPAMFVNEGISYDDITILQLTQKIRTGFATSNVDAMNAYLTEHPSLFGGEAIEYNVINPIAYGLDFYGDCLFTTFDELLDHPDRVRAFRDASLRGWDYAMRNAEEIIDLIVEKYESPLNREQLLYEAEAMRGLMLPGLIEIGHMSQGRWRHIADTFAELGFLPNDYDLGDFIYNPQRTPSSKWPRYALYVSSAILLVLFAAAIVLFVFNRKLRNMVQMQTSGLLLMNRQQQAILDNSSMLIGLLKPDGTLVDVNQTALSLIGAVKEDVLGERFWDTPWWSHSKETQEDIRRIVEQASVEKRTIKSNAIHIGAQGEEHKIEFSVAPILDEAGELVMLVPEGYDVTGVVKAEKALRESEAKYRQLVERANSIILRRGKDFTITYINKFALNFFGYTEEEILGKSLLGTIVPETESTGRDLRQMLRDITAQPEQYANNQNENIRRNGERVWISWTNRPILDEDGNLVEVLSIGNDITDFKRIQDRVQETERQFRAVLDYSPFGVFVCRLDQNNHLILISANDSSNRILGVDCQQHIGKTIENAFPELRGTKIVDEYLRVALEGGQYKAEQIDYEDNAIKGSYEVTAYQIAPGDIAVMFLDVTERTKAEQAMRRHLEEVERFNRLAIGREQRVIELKSKVNDLMDALGGPLPYKLTSEEVYIEGESEPAVSTSDEASSPESSPEQYSLEQLLDHDYIKVMLDNSAQNFGISAAIVDMESDLFAGTTWQRLCSEFHFKNEKTRKICDESDTILSGQLAQGQTFFEYHCGNGLVDTAAPIMLEGQKIGNILVGQFLMEPPDMDFFCAQAEKYGFDKQSYLEAVKEVPILPAEKLKVIIDYLTASVSLVAQIGLGKFRAEKTRDTLAQHARELDKANKELRIQREAALSLAQDANEARTEAERTQKKIHENEKNLRIILDVSPLPILWADTTGKIMFQNRKSDELFGKTLVDVAMLKSMFLTAEPDPTGVISITKEYADAVKALFSGSSDISGKEYVLNAAAGCIRTVEVFRSFFGKRILFIFNDITERKETEKRHEELEKQLAQSQKMEAIGRLAGGVAHDFNNMLSVILGHAELLTAESAERGETPEGLYEIADAANHAKNITSQLLSFSRQQVVMPKPLDLNELINKTQKTLQRLIGENILLKFAPGEDLWRIECDPAQIDQILFNLSINSRDAMPDGGTIKIQTANVQVDEMNLTAYPGLDYGDYVHLSVRDNGAGMPADVLEHIFEPFFTTKELGKGTGLGLATVYAIIEQNGGCMDVESDLGKGAVFNIYLPRCLDTIRERKDIADKVLPKGAGTILVVEDEGSVRMMVKQILEKTGYDVLVAGDAKEASGIIGKTEETIDLLLTDLVMPGTNGLDLCERMRTVKPDLKCIVMSGYAPETAVRGQLLKEEMPFIKKPFGVADLVRKIQEVMANP